MDKMISIIIPVYNTEKYLSTAIESALNQTYKNIEIILVDDGSTDDSGKICDEYALKNSNVEVIHSVNRGPSVARSLGVESAKGDYVMFIDSDDWVDAAICSKFISEMDRHSTDSAMCGYVREYPYNSIPKMIYDDVKVMTGNEIQQTLCGPLNDQLKSPENIDCLNCIPLKLYPLNSVKKVRMPDLKDVGTSEDLLFNLEVFGYIKSCVYVNEPLYHYRKSVDSSITNTYKSDLPEKWDYLFEYIRKYIKYNNFPEIFNIALENRIAISSFNLSLNAIFDKSSLFEKKNRIKNVISDKQRKKSMKIIQTKSMPFYWKLFFFFAKNKMSFSILLMLSLANKLKGKI